MLVWRSNTSWGKTKQFRWWIVFIGGVTSPKIVLFEIKSCNDALIGLDGGVASFENILDQNRINTDSEALVCMEILCSLKCTNSLILTKARALGRVSSHVARRYCHWSHVVRSCFGWALKLQGKCLRIQSSSGTESKKNSRSQTIAQMENIAKSSSNPSSEDQRSENNIKEVDELVRSPKNSAKEPQRGKGMKITHHHQKCHAICPTNLSA